ncbi:MAG: hypothetical protein HYZ16_08530 [Bacteroidetes bacterium]|nr:hypothetical protein [Bacteroidota bacterium]
MKHIIALCVLQSPLSNIQLVYGQDEIDSFALVKGSFNVSVLLGSNSGRNSSTASGLESPMVTVGNILLGYQYIIGDKWGINTGIGVGYQPFKLRTRLPASKSYFNRTVFMLPYFIFQAELKRRFSRGLFVSVSAHLHINTTARFEQEYAAINPNVANFKYLYINRNLSDYSGIQHGVGFYLGKQILQGNWSGIDLFLTAVMLNRQKLTIDYYTEPVLEDFQVPNGQLSYGGSYIGIGICYNFAQKQ